MTTPAESPVVSWPTVRLGDVARTSSGGTPSRGTARFYGGNIPWVKSGELGDRTIFETGEFITAEGVTESSAKIFPKGTLCIALYGATVGKLGILGIDAATNQAVCGIFLPASLDTRFVYRFLEHKRRDLVDLAKGGSQPNISQDIVRNIRLPMPPLEVQQAVVAEIETQLSRLDAGIISLRRAQSNLKRYRASVLKAACEGKLVPAEAELATARGGTYEDGGALLGRILKKRPETIRTAVRYLEPVETNESDLPRLPNGWVWASLDQLANLIRNGISTKPEGNEGLPILRISAVRPLSENLSDVRFLSDGRPEYANYALVEGDLLFTRYTGNVDLVGVCGVVPPSQFELYTLTR